MTQTTCISAMDGILEQDYYSLEQFEEKAINLFCKTPHLKNGMEMITFLKELKHLTDNSPLDLKKYFINNSWKYEKIKLCMGFNNIVDTLALYSSNQLDKASSTDEEYENTEYNESPVVCAVMRYLVQEWKANPLTVTSIIKLSFQNQTCLNRLKKKYITKHCLSKRSNRHKQKHLCPKIK